MLNTRLLFNHEYPDRSGKHNTIGSLVIEAKLEQPANVLMISPHKQTFLNE